MENVHSVFHESIGRSTVVVSFDDSRAPLASTGVDEPVANNSGGGVAILGDLGQAVVVRVGIGPVVP